MLLKLTQELRSVSSWAILAMINSIMHLSWKPKNYAVYGIYMLIKAWILSSMVILIIITGNRCYGNPTGLIPHEGSTARQKSNTNYPGKDQNPCKEDN